MCTALVWLTRRQSKTTPWRPPRHTSTAWSGVSREDPDLRLSSFPTTVEPSNDQNLRSAMKIVLAEKVSPATLAVFQGESGWNIVTHDQIKQGLAAELKDADGLV